MHSSAGSLVASECSEGFGDSAAAAVVFAGRSLISAALEDSALGADGNGERGRATSAPGRPIGET
jgi:hypothetical protein